MPVITDVADAVVSELNETEFSLPFTAQRHYLPRFELQDLKTLHVSVVPSGMTVETAGRSQAQRDVATDVAVQKKLTHEQNADLDPLLALTEEIAEHFCGKRLSSYPDAIWVKTEFKPIYAVEHLDQLRQFTSVMTLTFRVLR